MAKNIIYETLNKNGVYSCGNIGISTSEWYDLLLDNGAQQYIDALLCFLREPEHTGSCATVSSKNGNTAQHYNSKITNFCKWTQKKLNKFTVKGIDGKDAYWCIAMIKGWESKQGFQWQMRDELVKALQNYLMHGLIQEYKTKEPFNGKDEEYKWALLDEAEGKDIYGIIKCLRGKNVVYNEQVDGIFKKLWETKPKELTACINNLLDETRAVIPRIEDFRDEMREICPGDWKACANDERTASAILTCRYPNDYTFYKSEVYQVICRYFGFEYRDAFLKFEHFTDIINGFVADFGEEIQQTMLPQINKFKNKPLNLAVQTLFWCMKEEMKASMKKSQYDINSQETMQKKKYQEYIDLLEENKNLILTGAPGTGKTFMAKAIAEEMGAEVGFVQFHPSYDYTDFVEGLRPISKNGSVGFKLCDGVFKSFCKEAIMDNNDSKKIVLMRSQPIKETGFDNIYKSIVDDIKNGKLRTYNTAHKVQQLDVKDNRIVFRAGSEHPRTEKEENIKLMYNHLARNNVFDISQYEKDDFWSLISKLTNGRTKTIDYMEYSWVLQELLRRTTKLETFETPVINHPDVVMSNDAIAIVNGDRNEPHKFVFIIDEINRGEISKIFGELFFSIDPGYRGEKGRVCTQYQNMIEEGDAFKKGFFVPENVYIIGTMNNIDRSVESMDFAMRRRFTWKEVTPSDTEYMLDTLGCAKEAKATMHRLNKAIDKTEGLGAAYMIGPAYFLKLGENGCDFVKLWKMSIEPLLKEYLRGFRKSSEILNKFSCAYFNKNNESRTDIPELIDED